ncbi:TIGR04282 family arsenosugar biosynthesis glycosyltransferase [Pseudolysinimonas sp.]|uniref:TIGR04282 family arsenosugar biosynthesis glycosyltransferase n=1 Tax=Pseudolysinimonas sp. TaxID=2680009 RepID=UPI003F812BC5
MTDLVVIAKECLPGRVKTRLHPPFSLEEAAELAAASLDDTLDTLADLPFERRIIAFDGTTPPPLARGWEVVPQCAGGLDERLAAVFDAIDGPTVLVGMDTPQVEAGVLSAALPDWPDDTDAVFGPAVDGGFWALGMREARGDLIRGVPMSQSDTGVRQLARLTAAGLRVRLLPPLLDVDDIGSARRVAEAAPDGRFAATLRRFDRPALVGAA